MILFRDQWRDRLDAIAQRWIGYARPPVHAAMAEADWSPDDRRDYCSRCGVSVALGEATAGGCGSCREKPGVLDGVVRLGAYANPLREWVLGVKYNGWAEMGVLLGEQLGQRVREASRGQVDDAVVVPVPMPWARRVHRGVDHATLIARGVARELDAPIVSVLSRRTGTPQVALSRTQRRRSGSHGMRVRSVGRYRVGARWIDGATVVLVDDVCTTGSTMRAAGRLLKTLRPALVLAAVVAVSDDPARRKLRDRPPGSLGSPGSLDAQESQSPLNVLEEALEREDPSVQ